MTDGPTKIETPQPLGADGTPIALPDPGIISPEERDRRQTTETFEHLEARGFPLRGTPVGEDLHAMLNGLTPVSAELQAQAERKLASLEKSADWRKRFFDGEERAVREFHLATAIIAAGKAQRLNEL